jgi:hypothetical protein
MGHALDGVSPKYVSEIIIVRGPAIREAQETISARVFELLGLKVGGHHDVPLVPGAPRRARPFSSRTGTRALAEGGSYGR